MGAVAGTWRSEDGSLLPPLYIMGPEVIRLVKLAPLSAEPPPGTIEHLYVLGMTVEQGWSV